MKKGKASRTRVSDSALPEVDKEIQEKKEIINIANDIKEKCQELKDIKAGIQKVAGEYLQPIINPLKTLTTIEQEKLKRHTILTKQPAPVPVETSINPVEAEELESTITDDLKLPRLNNVYYGLRFDPETNKFFVGSVPAEITESTITVGNKIYTRTKGLISLLTTKHFQQKSKYKKDDLQAYRDIIKETKVYETDRGTPKPIKGPSELFIKRLLNSKVSKKASKKVKQVKSVWTSDNETRYESFGNPLTYSTPIRGSGIGSLAKRKREINTQIRRRMMVPSQAEQEYIYYDNPNELVERLKLLYGEQLAGNVNNPQINNEIQHILEELEELGFIH